MKCPCEADVGEPIMVDTKRVGKGIGQFVAVALPSLFILLWTIDAALVPGADVFLVALVQVIFIAVFVGYLYRKHPV